MEKNLQKWDKGTSLQKYGGHEKYVKTILYTDDHVILATSDDELQKVLSK
jgi:hypothetical protein